jgi:hypothetical protein
MVEKELETVEQELDKDNEKPTENIRQLMNDLFDDETSSDASDTESSKDLDTSWIQEHEKLSAIQENYQREPMDSIRAYFVYVNRNQYIEKIISDKIPLQLHDDKSFSYISKETLLQIIQSRKIKTSFSKYKLVDVLSYLVELEPEHIQNFSQNGSTEQSLPYFKVVSILDDIRLNHSIFIFHALNSIYFLFEEVELVNHRHTLKSILKPILKPNQSESNKSNTKKVRIQEGNVERIQNNHSHSRVSKKHRITRKQFTK